MINVKKMPFVALSFPNPRIAIREHGYMFVPQNKKPSAGVFLMHTGRPIPINIDDSESNDCLLSRSVSHTQVKRTRRSEESQQQMHKYEQLQPLVVSQL
jgi:hypothetical protein